EDGIRDKLVTGVQTCALPIWELQELRAAVPRNRYCSVVPVPALLILSTACFPQTTSTSFAAAWRKLSSSARRTSNPLIGYGAVRSEERRVGKEGRCRWSQEP